MIHWLQSLFKRNPKPRFEDLKFDTPEQLAEWMVMNLHYIPEPGYENYIKTPEETFKDGGGDCDDFSFFTQHFFCGQLIGIWSESKSHCVNLAQDYRIMDLCRLKYFNGRSIEGICDALMPDWVYYGFLRRGRGGQAIITRKINKGDHHGDAERK